MHWENGRREKRKKDIKKGIFIKHVPFKTM